jgi:lipopolysaccharide transport system ATP-binding protein
MKDIAVKAENISKHYRLGSSNASILSLITGLFSAASSETNEFKALNDISFEVEKGEAVGIIGKNGAGKSTLLKILSRITEPTSGRITIDGRVASLLEVGTGFHPELTGRENIFLNGTILGMSRKEIKQKLDEIIEFSGVSKFIDTPVKHYSSGMHVRLAFSVAAHLEPEILIIDEVLAVGDAEFQNKCLGKMKDVTGQGRTILFVSHNMGAVRSLCKKGIFIEKGNLKGHGNVSDIIEQYFSGDEKEATEGIYINKVLSNNTDVIIRNIRVINDSGEVSDIFDTSRSINIEISYEAFTEISGSRINIQLLDIQGNVAFTSSSHNSEPSIKKQGKYRALCIIPPDLLNGGEYRLFVHMGIPGVKFLSEGRVYLRFKTFLMGNNGSTFLEKWPGIVAPKLNWQITELKI